MTPTEAKFDGARGVRFRVLGEYLRFHLLRSESKTPKQRTGYDFKEHLVWLYPTGQPHRLVWCNEDGDWFEVNFTPIDKP